MSAEASERFSEIQREKYRHGYDRGRADCLRKAYDQALEDVLSVIQWDGYTLDIKERIEKLKRQNFKERNKLCPFVLE